jgi:dUTP pyrophosphatase
MEILIKRLHETAKLPVYATDAEGGMNLYAAEEVAIEPRTSATVGTGVAFGMPVGYVGLVMSQHSLVLDNRIKVTPDRVDSGFRGEVRLELVNTGDDVYHVNVGDVVGHLLVQKVHRAHLIEAEDLSGE